MLLTSRITQPPCRAKGPAQQPDSQPSQYLHSAPPPHKNDLQTQHAEQGTAGERESECVFILGKKAILSRLVFIQREEECHDIIKAA